MLSVRRFCLNKLTILSFFLFISSHINAQIDIKSKVDAQTYAEYSKAIDLIGKVFPYNSSNVTILIPDNFSITQLSYQNHNKIFIENTNTDIKNFLDKYIINEKLSELELSNIINSNSSLTRNNLKNESLIFTKNGNMVMISNNNMFESNINRVINFNNNITIVLLFGGFEN